MPDTFAGAEQSVDKQKQSALNALAQYGRRGLESAALAQREASGISQGVEGRNVATAPAGHNRERLQAALGAIGQPVAQAYDKNAAQAKGFLETENLASQAVNRNFFDQVRQAVPMARTNAAQVVDEYRAAYAQRRAEAAAQAQMQQQELAMAAEQMQMERDMMAQEAQLRALELYGPGLADALRREAASKRQRAIRPTATHMAGGRSLL
jgi:hypothetical protein